MQRDENVSDEDDNVFFFESDHLALRGNKDYKNIIRTITVLESQRTRAHKDLENLMEARTKYMNDPELFLKKLKNNEPLVEPHEFSTAKIPEINGYPLMPTDDVKVKQEPNATPPVPAEVPKSETHNRQLWSCDEQRRLEELLIEYPAEPFESRRFAKIAKALGTRTPQQVSSRVQKYFQKLYEAGMPIPGRIPKKRRLGVNRTKNVFRPSTFFPSNIVPVQMSEHDDMPLADFTSLSMSASRQQEDADAAPTHGDTSVQIAALTLSKQSKAQMVSILRLLRDEKKALADGYLPDPMAQRCEHCNMDSVSRYAWFCKTCQIFLSSCADCLTARLVGNRFKHINHIVEATETQHNTSSN